MRRSVPQAMQALDPEQTDLALLASLPPSVASLVQERTDFSYLGPYGFEPRFEGFTRLQGPVPADMDDSLAVVEQASAPAPREFVVKELARLRMSTKARPEAEDDLSMMAAVYADALRVYPADIVADACRKWARMEKWWPSLSELIDMADFRMRKRARLAELLRAIA